MIPQVIALCTEGVRDLLNRLLSVPPPLDSRCFNDVDLAAEAVCAALRDDIRPVVFLDAAHNQWQEMAAWLHISYPSINMILIAHADVWEMRIIAGNFGVGAFMIWPDEADQVHRLATALLQ